MAFAEKRLHRRGQRALAKNCPFSSKLRGFAPSREPVISARPAPMPPSPRLASQPALATSPPRPGPMGSGHKQQPGPERLRARPCGRPVLLPVACKNRQAGDRIGSLCQKSLCASSVRSVPLWWDRWSYGYNYQRIVIANRRRCIPNSEPGELPLPEAGSPGTQARPASCPQARALVRQASLP